jgi:hypothetical protein
MRAGIHHLRSRLAKLEGRRRRPGFWDAPLPAPGQRRDPDEPPCWWSVLDDLPEPNWTDPLEAALAKLNARHPLPPPEYGSPREEPTS